MAVGEIMEKLYPPVINGSLPAFYSEIDENGTTNAKIVVPFSMNRAVNMEDINGFKLKIKTVQSNTLITILSSISYTNQEVIFHWPNISKTNTITNKKINIGQFLKVQLAYYKIEQTDEGQYKENVGYFSTVGIIKYTSKPKVYIEDLGENNNQVAIFQSEYTGIYETTEDKNERPYAYKFSLYDNNLSLIETSDWQLHNTSINNVISESVSLDKATDIYNFNTTLKLDTEYYLQYTVRTINNLEINSPLYLCMDPETENSTLPLEIHSENVFEEGYIRTYLSLKKDCNYFITITPEEIKQKYEALYEADNIISVNWNETEVVAYYDFYKNDNFLHRIWIHYSSNNTIVESYNILEEGYKGNVNSIEDQNRGEKFIKFSYFLQNNPISLEFCRAEKTDNFSSWRILNKKFFANADELLQWELKDFTIEQGITYKYCFRQYTKTEGKGTVKSNRVIANAIMADFEDMFLYDGKKQIKIRFNPKVSSFKINHLEQKTDTIGNRYPFIFRNGIVEYKEFPISGLISYHMDNNELFINHEEDLNIILGKYSERRNTPVLQDENDINNKKSWELSESLDSVGYNMMAERHFKLKLLEWLNNGEIKLFKSPAEGNYLVRLLNISLTPDDKLGRMIHSFSCTAYEMKEYNYNNLRDLGFLNINETYTTEPILITGKKIKDIIDNLTNVYDLIQINEYSPIYEYLRFYIPSTGRFGTSQGFYIRIGNSNQTKVLISPARGFIIDDFKQELPNIYFSPYDNLELIGLNSASNVDFSTIKAGLKDLIGDTQIDYKYRGTTEQIGEFNNLSNIYLKTVIKTVNGPTSLLLNSSLPDEIHKLLKIYTLHFQEKEIRKIKREIVEDQIWYYDFTNGQNNNLNNEQILEKDLDELVIYEVYNISTQDPEELNLDGYYYIKNNKLQSVKEQGQIDKSINLYPIKGEPSLIPSPPTIDIVQEYDQIQLGEGVFLDIAYLEKIKEIRS